MEIETLDHSFTNLPEKVEKENYQQVASGIVEYLSKFFEVHSLYQYGSLKAPGMSDLDILLVVRDGRMSDEFIEKVGKMEVSGKVSEICENKFYKILSTEHMSQIKTLGEIDTTLLYGKGVPIEAINNDEKLYYQLCNCMDWLPERVLTVCLHKKKETISGIKLVGDLYSLSHSLKLATQVINMPAEYSSYQASLDSLRAEWFNAGIPKSCSRLLELTDQGVLIGQIVMERITSFVMETKMLSEDETSGDRLGYLRGDIGFRFVSCEKYAEICQQRKHLERNLLPVPSVWRDYYRVIACGNTPLDKLVRNNFDIRDPSVDYPEIYGNQELGFRFIARKRFQLCADIYDFINSNRLGNEFLYRFGHMKMVDRENNRHENRII